MIGVMRKLSLDRIQNSLTLLADVNFFPEVFGFQSVQRIKQTLPSFLPIEMTRAFMPNFSRLWGKAKGLIRKGM